MLAKVFRKHQHHRNLYKLGRLKLAQWPRQFDPTALPIDFHADVRNQDDHEQDQAQHVQDRRQFNQPPVVGERDCQHCDERNA